MHVQQKMNPYACPPALIYLWRMEPSATGENIRFNFDTQKTPMAGKFKFESNAPSLRSSHHYSIDGMNLKGKRQTGVGTKGEPFKILLKRPNIPALKLPIRSLICCCAAPPTCRFVTGAGGGGVGQQNRGTVPRCSAISDVMSPTPGDAALFSHHALAACCLV